MMGCDPQTSSKMCQARDVAQENTCWAPRRPRFIPAPKKKVWWLTTQDICSFNKHPTHLPRTLCPSK